MNVRPYHTSSYFLGQSGAQNMVFCLKFESYIQQKRHRVDHNGIIQASGGSSNHAHTSKEGQEIIKQQWVSILITQHHISLADQVPQNVLIRLKCECLFGRKDDVLTLGVSYMLLKALSIYTYTHSKGYETLRQQWMSFVTVQHTICCSERVHKI